MHWSFIIRIVQLLFAILVLALAAAAIGEFHTGFNSLNFLLFCGIWAILSLIYLVVTPSKFPQIHHKFIACGVEFLCMIFFFAGFIAVAADIGNLDCNLLDDNFFGDNLKTGCQCTKAAIAFGAFSWVLWLVTLVLVVREVYLEHSGNASVRGPAVDVGNKDVVNLDEPGRHPMSEPVV